MVIRRYEGDEERRSNGARGGGKESCSKTVLDPPAEKHLMNEKSK